MALPHTLNMDNIIFKEPIPCGLKAFKYPIKYLNEDEEVQPLCISLYNCVTYGVKDGCMAVYIKDPVVIDLLEKIQETISSKLKKPIHPIIKSDKGVFYPKLYTEFKSDKITTAFYNSEGYAIDPVTTPCRIKIAITIKELYSNMNSNFLQIRVNEVEVLEELVRKRLL